MKPGSERLRASVIALSEATTRLFDARDAPDVEAHFGRQLEAVRRFEDEVRKLAGR